MNDIARIEQLIIQQNIIGQIGELTFSYAGFQITVFSKDAIGNSIQDWFGQWLNSQGIVWTTGIHTQSWPDFILSDTSHLEVKAFDAEASPNFDVANFDGFVRSLWNGDVHRLDTMHLVFSYIANPETGAISINDYWLKNIWELTGPSGANILSIQKKQGTAVNIRPKNWRNPRVQMFTSRQEFVSALAQAVIRFRPGEYLDWYSVVENHYVQQFGRPL